MTDPQELKQAAELLHQAGIPFVESARSERDCGCAIIAGTLTASAEPSLALFVCDAHQGVGVAWHRAYFSEASKTRFYNVDAVEAGRVILDELLAHDDVP